MSVTSKWTQGRIELLSRQYVLITPLHAHVRLRRLPFNRTDSQLIAEPFLVFMDGSWTVVDVPAEWGRRYGSLHQPDVVPGILDDSQYLTRY